MKKVFLVALAVIATVSVRAQEKSDTTYWTKKGAAGVNMSQVSLTNWAAGGEGSVAVDLLFSYSADYKKAKTLWQNRLELAYGLTNMEASGTRKTNDKIYMSSNYGYKIANNLYASALVTFNTQFVEGYDYKKTPKALISDFMAPGYLNLGLGVTWTPKKWFTATFSPINWRETFVLNDDLSNAGAYGVKIGDKTLAELGANLKMEAKYEIMKNTQLYSRLDLFSNYLKDPQNIVVNWDTQVSMKVNKWISATLNLNMVYDDKIKIAQSDGTSGPRIQLKESLGIGLLVNF